MALDDGVTLMSPLVRIGLSDPNTVPAVEKLVSDSAIERVAFQSCNATPTQRAE